MRHVQGKSPIPPTRLDRRRLLAGGVTLGAATIIGGVVGAEPAQAALVTAGRIGRPGWPMRRRTGLTTVNGRQLNAHNAGQSFQFDSAFLTKCNDWATYFNAQWSDFLSSSIKPAWIGASHVLRSYPPESNHVTGKAMDLTAIGFDNGGYIDCNYSHRTAAPVNHQRWYIGLAWTGRRFFPELGIVGTGANHEWHIHMGNSTGGNTSVLLRQKGRWDVLLVQRTARVLMGANIALDGKWGPQTSAAFTTMLSRLGLSGINPFSNTQHFAQLCYGLSARGLGNRAL